MNLFLLLLVEDQEVADLGVAGLGVADLKVADLEEAGQEVVAGLEIINLVTHT